MLERIDHVAFAVADIDVAIQHYTTVWGLSLAHREVVSEQGVEEAMFRLGESYLQLVTPLSPDTPVGRFLERRGEGLHHIAYRVASVRQALAEAVAAGQRPVDATPRRGSRGTLVAFIHPLANHGVLVELVQDAGLPPGQPGATQEAG